jgi:hypothetical protein
MGYSSGKDFGRDGLDGLSREAFDLNRMQIEKLLVATPIRTNGNHIVFVNVPVKYQAQSVFVIFDAALAKTPQSSVESALQIQPADTHTKLLFAL